MKIKFELQY